MQRTQQIWLDVFPTPVGMNRYKTLVRALGGGVPHTRGDEP